MLNISDHLLGWPLRVIAAILCLLAEAAWSFGEDKVVDVDTISKWKAYERFSRSLQGAARKCTTFDSGKIERSQIAFKQNEDCTLSCLSDERSSTDLYRIGNPRYAASIKRSKSDPYEVVLDKFTEDPYAVFPGYSGNKASVFVLDFPGISPHFSIGVVPLSQFVIDPMFKLTNTSKESENGQELVRLDYTYLNDDLKNERQSKGSVSLFLDPSHCWCLRRIKTSSKTTKQGVPVQDSEHEKEFEVIEHPSGFPLVKTQTSRDNVYPYSTKNRLVYTTRIDYEWEVNDSVPDREFTLSAFGLPEPGGAEPVKKPTPTYVWILSAAGICGVIAVAFRYLARRRAVTSTA